MRKIDYETRATYALSVGYAAVFLGGAGATGHRWGGVGLCVLAVAVLVLEAWYLARHFAATRERSRGRPRGRPRGRGRGGRS